MTHVLGVSAIVAICSVTSIVITSNADASKAPSFVTDSLTSVSCASPTMCMAMGSTSYDAELSEAWNGVQWVVVKTPKTPKSRTPRAKPFDMQSVSCAAGTCTAAGFRYGVQGAVIEQWNGSSWVAVRFPKSKVPLGSFDNISCADDGFCAAVGTPGSLVLTRETTTSKWVRSSISPPSPSWFQGVSCTSSSSCIALGTNTAVPGQLGPNVLAQWDGSAWSIDPTQVPEQNVLGRISCVSASQCTAVGDIEQSTTSYTPLAESWNGTSWTVDATVPVSTAAYFTSVSCPTSTFCMTVGDNYRPPNEPAVVYPLAQEWDGSSWSSVNPPTPAGAGFSYLSAVSCTGPSYCVAVGDYANAVVGYSSATFIEQWNGTTWSIVPSPSP
jgi:hypothetical protein